MIANQRGLIKGSADTPPRIGGIIYTESAEKVSFFIETANRERIPLLFVQDVSGFMVGPEAEHSGIIRPTPDPLAFTPRLIRSGFCLTTGSKAFAYLDRCQRKGSLPDKGRLLQILMP